LRKQVQFLRKKYKAPVFVVIDYLQKLAAQVARDLQAQGEKPDLRQATTIASSMLCTIAEEDEATILAVSSGGRSSAAKLRGSRGGRFIDVRDIPPSELVDTAKESGDVEYDAAGLITLSVSDETDADGFQVATMTVAKARYGRVQHIAMAYNGAGGVWHDRGRVERKKVEEERAELTAERIQLLNKIAADAMEWLARAPLSLEGLRRQMKRSRTDIELAIAPAIQTGAIVRVGAGPKQKLALGTPALPGIDTQPKGLA
jgi:NADPH-dependent glutamate synthase beta subunit-like oxidoreductase